MICWLAWLSPSIRDECGFTQCSTGEAASRKLTVRRGGVSRSGRYSQLSHPCEMNAAPLPGRDLQEAVVRRRLSTPQEGSAFCGANRPYTGYEEIKVQISAREEILLEAFRRLPAEAANELSALAQRLATLTPVTKVDWSDSWSDADLREIHCRFAQTV